MARTPAPSLPTPKQIRDIHETVTALYPLAKIKKVGPDGVTFDYSDATEAGKWAGVPFEA